MRRGHMQRPPATDNVSLAINNFHDTPFNARRLVQNVYLAVIDRDNILQVDSIYLSHPSARQDLQIPLALTAISLTHTPILIENQYLTGAQSTKYPNISTYTIFMYLHHDADYKNIIKTFVTEQLTEMHTTELSTSTGGLEALKVTESSTYPI